MNLLLLAVLLPAVCFAAVPLSMEQDPHAKLFVAWKHKFGKDYNRATEEVARFKIWKDNMQKVMDHNIKYELGLESYFLGMNAFADLTSEEFVAQRNGYKKDSRVPPVGGVQEAQVSGDLPSEVDWRTKGWVTGVKDQGQCGSCWAFSTTGGLEGQHMNATGSLVSLSEEQLVQCDLTNYGCNGGNMNIAIEYLAGVGSAGEEEYPYTSGTGYRGQCQMTGKSIMATVTTYVALPYGNEATLQEAVANVGPCSIAIDASQFSFQLYSGGVYYEPNCSSYRLDHGVLVVGYGSESGKDYWLVKNSWGESWGDEGYIKMSRNKNNNCGIASDAIYPVV